MSWSDPVQWVWVLLPMPTMLVAPTAVPAGQQVRVRQWLVVLWPLPFCAACLSPVCVPASAAQASCEFLRVLLRWLRRAAFALLSLLLLLPPPLLVLVPLLLVPVLLVL